MIERQHLSILLETDRLGSVTAAGEALHLTQSALSHAIRRLEAQAGVALWEKDGRRLRPTQAGRHLIALAQRILPQIEQAEATLADFARGQRGMLRIGMECHPCYRWLLRVVEPYLAAWPAVDVDVRQAFQFGGVGALLGHEIDLLITPDPVERPGLVYEPVFNYEMRLAVAEDHPIAGEVARPGDLTGEVLITYPVSPERLDIYTRFLVPAGCLPRAVKVIETTDIMLRMVAAGRGVTALPDWLIEEYRATLPIRAPRLGPEGIAKSIHIGRRAGDAAVDYVEAFIALARAA
ncbi:MAG: LysR family transcriptional regulator [Rhodovulum sulfidophilum]|uniref:HTH-type transcriptional regulator MetR n=1 Tax=Rhodovulum sulfidophilum TaxID=35806 RepID=A0A2W5NHF8_RHOSU|nr:MAG: LysR family transcriptional regulator [Rhodovulum sulfidophilum]